MLKFGVDGQKPDIGGGKREMFHRGDGPVTNRWAGFLKWNSSCRTLITPLNTQPHCQLNSPTVGFRFLTFCCFVLFNAEIAFAGIVDFEGLAPGLVPNGYQGLDTWNNFAVISPSSSPDSGYPNAIISGLNVGYNGAGDDASILNSSTFSLKSGYFTAAWNDNLSLNVVGYKGNIPLFNNTYSLSSTSPLLINFDYDEIDKVVFHSGGGSPNPGYRGGGVQFAVDDLTINAIPEPSTYAALLGALAFGFTAIRRAKNRLGANTFS